MIDKFMKAEQLRRKGLKLAKELLKIIDKIYALDEIAGDSFNDAIHDEAFLRGKPY